MDMTIFLKYLPEAVLAALAVLVVVLSVFLVKKQRQYEELWELVEQKFAKEALKKEMRKEESGIYRKFVPIPLMQILGIQKICQFLPVLFIFFRIGSNDLPVKLFVRIAVLQSGSRIDTRLFQFVQPGRRLRTQLPGRFFSCSACWQTIQLQG